MSHCKLTLCCELNLIGIGGLKRSFPIPGSEGSIGEASNFLFFVWRVAHFLVFGVRGEFEIFGITLEPLAVFCSVHTTLSYLGEEEAVRARFAHMRGSTRGLEMGVGE